MHQGKYVKVFVTATQLLEHFEITDIRHVPRNENQEANKLAQIASGYKMSKSKFQDMIEFREKMASSTPPPTEDILDKNDYRMERPDEECQEACIVDNYGGHGVFTVNNSSPMDWRKPIVEYLENPIGSADRKTKYKALSYMLLGNELLKKTPEGVILKFLGDTKAYLSIYEVHNGTCCAHQAGHKMKWLLFQQGVYWPSMLKHYIELAKGCQECQRHTDIQHMSASELHAIIKLWLFRGWALDVIKEIQPASSKQQKFILIGIDYFTKWIQDIPLVKVDQDTVIEFIQNHIVYRFGIPYTITTDQRSVFVAQKMQEFAGETV